MQIDTTAPVTATATIHIAAPPEQVWRILSDINNWPTWNPDIKTAALAGDLQPGAVFTWKAGPGGITSRLTHVEPLTGIAWTGKTLGIKAVHVWRLQPQADGTAVITEESWRGWPVLLFKKASQKQLAIALQNGVKYLKQAAEQRA